MNEAEQLAEANLLIDSYGAQSALVRLAELASPACRIEPQLLRQLRLACVPDADVSVEQELWHSEFASSRGKTITFRPAVAQVLRDRLRKWRATEPALVERARQVMTDLHADLSPLLVLEDALAWADVFDDVPSIRRGAENLMQSLLAGRDGLNHWLGRAWAGLPKGLKALPEGRELAQIAAAEGASIDEDSPPVAERVAHTLPTVTVPLRLHGLSLDVNVPPEQATHAVEVPRTRPLALSVTWSRGSEQLTFNSEARSLHVSPGKIVLGTLSGAEYELEAIGGTAAFSIEMLPAGRGTSLIIEYGSEGPQKQVIVDCGDRRTGKILIERLSAEDNAQIELLVLTHNDDDRIGGALSVLQALGERVREVWFNGRAPKVNAL